MNFIRLRFLALATVVAVIATGCVPIADERYGYRYDDPYRSGGYRAGIAPDGYYRSSDGRRFRSLEQRDYYQRRLRVGRDGYVRDRREVDKERYRRRERTERRQRRDETDTRRRHIDDDRTRDRRRTDDRQRRRDATDRQRRRDANDRQRRRDATDRQRRRDANDRQRRRDEIDRQRRREERRNRNTGVGRGPGAGGLYDGDRVKIEQGWRRTTKDGVPMWIDPEGRLRSN